MSTSNSISDSRQFELCGNTSGISLPQEKQRAQSWKKLGASSKALPLATFAMFTVSVVALGLTSYLSWAAISSSKVAGCGSGELFDCGHVLQSKWSTAFGIPVGIPATGIYISILLSLLTVSLTKQPSINKFAKSVLSICSLTAALAAIWFVSLQLFIVEHLCSYCLAAHACGLILAALVFWKSKTSNRNMAIFTSIAFASVSVLATNQVVAESPQTYQIERHSIRSAAAKGKATSESLLFVAPGTVPDTKYPDTSSGEVFEAPAVPKKINSKDETKNEKSAVTTSEFEMSLIGMFSQRMAFISARPQKSSHSKPRSRQDESPSSGAEKDSPKPERLVHIMGGNLKLKFSQWPSVGNAKAESVIVEMFDYTCPHCRASHKSVSGLKKQLGEKLALLCLAVPMNSNCNSEVNVTNSIHSDACVLARLATAVWRIDASKFPDFHEWLFTGDVAPTAASARSKAEALVGKDNLQNELATKVADQYVARQIQLYQAIGGGTVPKLLFPNTSVTGKVGDKRSLLKIVKQQKPEQ